MKPQELRIGSFYHSVKFDIPVTLDISNLTQLDYDRDGAELDDETIDRMFKPIPITKEWLLKFSFNHNKVGVGVDYFSFEIEPETKENPRLYVYFHFSYDKITESGITSSEIDRGRGYENERSYLINKIQYVHQLQNLFQALTGEELTIKSDSQPSKEIVLITGCEGAEGFRRTCTTDELESVAKKIYAEHPGENGYYNFTKYLWVLLPGAKEEVRLDNVIPYE